MKSKWICYWVVISTLILSSRPPTVQGQSEAENRLYIPLVVRDFSIGLRTKINDITTFLLQCPTSDPAYAQFRADFVIRRNGSIIDAIPCSEPIQNMPREQRTDELLALQTFRTIYYLDPETPNHLPWTSDSLYAWMHARIRGVNIKDQGGIYCCDLIDGEPYFVTTVNPMAYASIDNWNGISGSVSLFAHETRHRDSDDPGHTTGCADFPNPNGPAGCDSSYDKTRLGGYGVAYWLHDAWRTGFLNVGISCNPTYAPGYIGQHVAVQNNLRKRFVTSVPPVVASPAPPLGGPCYLP